MLFIWLTRLLIGTAVLFAVRKGDEPERLAATILASELVLDVCNHYYFGDSTWFEVNPGHLVIDTWALLCFLWIAIHANRGWPLVMAALQLIVVAGHMTKLLEFEDSRRSYWVMTEVPPVCELIVVLLGTATHAARQRRIGAYHAWRLA